jgi:tetratricopeptide (TPR) repeat protein
MRPIIHILLQLYIIGALIVVSSASPVDSLVQARRQIEAGKSLEGLKILNKLPFASMRTNSQYFFLKGRAEQELRRNIESLTSYSIAIYLNPSFTNAFINRALVKGALKDLDGALDDLNQALVLDPKNKVALLNRGVTRAGIGKSMLAIDDFNHAIKIDNRYADAFRNRGIVRYLDQDLHGACGDWIKSNQLVRSEVLEWITAFCGPSIQSSGPHGRAVPPRPRVGP